MSDNNSHSLKPSVSGLILANESGMEPYNHESGMEHYQNDHKSPVVVQENAQPESPSGQRNIWRGALIPILIAALIAAIITGAAVGGGVGASLAQCKSDLSQALSLSPTVAPSSLSSPSASSAPSASSSASFATTTGGLFVGYAPAPTGSVASLYDNCTALAQSLQITLFDDKFSIYCGIDLNSGGKAVETGASGEALVIADIAPIIAYTPQDCLQACSSYTKKSTRWGRTEICRSVAFSYNMSSSIEANGANCWLKNGTVAAPSQAIGCDNCLSAMLA